MRIVRNIMVMLTSLFVTVAIGAMCYEALRGAISNNEFLFVLCFVVITNAIVVRKDYKLPIKMAFILLLDMALLWVSVRYNDEGLGEALGFLFFFSPFFWPCVDAFEDAIETDETGTKLVWDEDFEGNPLLVISEEDYNKLLHWFYLDSSNSDSDNDEEPD